MRHLTKICKFLATNQYANINFVCGLGNRYLFVHYPATAMQRTYFLQKRQAFGPHDYDGADNIISGTLAAPFFVAEEIGLIC